MNNELPQINSIDDTEDKPNYVGIRAVNDKVEIIIPKFLSLTKTDDPENITNETNKKDKELLLCFLRSINIAKTLNKEYFKKQTLDGNSWPIESYLWIINDYLEKGYYFNREKQYFTDGKGKINWKKTIKNTPIISNNNIIYDKLITSRNSYIDSKITDIYKVCLKQSLEKMSWYRNLNIKINVIPTMSSNEMLHIVKKELSNTFDDIKRLRFNHMIKILSSTSNNDLLMSDYTLWINNYYYVYERMINYYFQGISEKEKEKFNPKGLWKIEGIDDPYDASHLRPDTIFVREKDNQKEIFILDAKMYKFGYTFNLADLPETTSIQKQITYGDHVFKNIRKMDEYKDAEIRNAFIIPYNCFTFNDPKVKLEFEPEQINDHLYYLGVAYAGWRPSPSEAKDYEKVYTFLIDFNFLLKNYAKSDGTDIDLLCNSIDEKINKNLSIID